MHWLFSITTCTARYCGAENTCYSKSGPSFCLDKMVWLQRTCSELLEEPHAGAEELIGAAQVAQVGPTQRQEQPQGWQVCL